MKVLIKSKNSFFVFAIKSLLSEIYIFNSVCFFEKTAQHQNDINEFDMYIQDCDTEKRIDCAPSIKTNFFLNIAFIDWNVKKINSKKCTNGILFINSRERSDVIKNIFVKAMNRKPSSFTCNNTCKIFSLSQKEHLVANLYQEGFSISYIAASLSLTSKTIYSHRNNIKNKFNAKSNTDLLRLLNILNPPL